MNCADMKIKAIYDEKNRFRLAVKNETLLEIHTYDYTKIYVIFLKAYCLINDQSTNNATFRNVANFYM